jgi:hypothetical protein
MEPTGRANARPMMNSAKSGTFNNAPPSRGYAALYPRYELEPKGSRQRYLVMRPRDKKLLALLATILAVMFICKLYPAV